MVEFLLAMRNWWVALCAECDLTAAQGHALRILDPKRPVPMSALAEALVCDASNVTGIVDKLIAGAMRAPAVIASLSGDVKSRLAGLLRTLMNEGLGR